MKSKLLAVVLVLVATANALAAPAYSYPAVSSLTSTDRVYAERWTGSNYVSRSLTGNDLASSWTLVVIPDIQDLTPDATYGPTRLAQLAGWIRTNRYAMNIRLVAGTGDSVTTPSTAAEWTAATNLWTTVSALGLPCVIPVGNHDYNTNSTRILTDYNNTFGPTWLAAQSWASGITYYEATNAANYTMPLRAGQADYLVANIEYAPRAVVAAWLATQAAANPGRQVLVFTHDFLHPDGRLSGALHSGLHLYSPGLYTNILGTVAGTDYLDGSTWWHTSATTIPNLAGVWNGHQLDVRYNPGRAVLAGTYGNQVLATCQNYQTLSGMTNLTYGFLRAYTFHPGGRISCRTIATANGADMETNRDRFTVDTLLAGAMPAGNMDTRVAAPLFALADTGLSDQLVFYAPLSEYTGATRFFDVAQGTIGTASVIATGDTAPAVTAGAMGNGLYTYARTRLVWPDNGRLSLAPALTISAWYKSSTDNAATILSAFEGSSTDGQFYLTLTATNAFNWTVVNSAYVRSNTTWTLTGTNIVDGAWHHIALAHSGSNATLYIDGVSQGASNSCAMPLQTVSHDIGLGCLALNTNDWACAVGAYLDQGRIWTRALADREIRALYRLEGGN